MIKKYAQVFLGVLAASMLAISASANVLVNPGFEDTPFGGAEEPGAGAGWTPFGAVFRVQCPGSSPGDACLDPVGSPDGAHDGIVVMKTFGVGGVFQDFAASAGETWDAGVWALNPDNADALSGGQIAAINIEWLDAGGTSFDAVLGPTIGAGDPLGVWTELLVSGVAPAGTAFARIVLITGDFAGPGGGAPRFDDAFFAPRPVPVPAAIWFLGSGLLGLIGMRRKSA